MAECNHVFIGRSGGAHCTKCGLYMTAEDYAAFLHPDQTAAKPKRNRKKNRNATERKTETPNQKEGEKR